MQADFERELSAKIRTRRLVTGCLALTCLAVFILFFILRESTKEVIVHEYGYSIIPSWTEVRYNNAYIPLIVLGLLGAMLSGSFLIMDFALCGYRTVHKDPYCVTIYRGMVHNAVYVDGQEKGHIGPFSHANVVEFWLPNQVRVTVSFSRVTWYMARVYFSDDIACREV